MTWQEHFENYNKTSMQGFSTNYTYYFQPNDKLTAFYDEPAIDFGATISNGIVVLQPEWYLLNGNIGSVVVSPQISTSADGVSWTDHDEGLYQVTTSGFRYVKYRINVTCDTNTEIVLTGCKTSVNLKTISEDGAGTVSVAATGVEITFSRSFIDVSSIVVTPLYDETKRLHAVYDFTDVPNPTSFTVYLYDEVTGAKTTGSFSYVVRGV